MRKVIAMLLVIMVLLLSACGSAATPAAEKPAVTAAPAEPAAPAQPAETAAVPTEPAPTQPPAPAEPTKAEPTAEAVQPAAPAGSATVYHIVPGESQVSYEVGEVFFSQNNRYNLAIGVTTQVQGDVTLDSANPAASQIGPIQIDISQFTSDSGRRDNVIRDRWLESGAYPMATFTPTAIEGLPATYTEGQEITFKVTGDLTVKQVTKPVTFDVTAKLQGGVLTGTATTTILLSDFGVGPIEIGGMLKTEDQAKLTLAFVARP